MTGPPVRRREAAFAAADPTGPRKYYRARYYDPKIGRFMSEDPIRWAGGNNFYAYVGNNPVNRKDPFGLKPCCSGGDPFKDYQSCVERCLTNRLSVITDPETYSKCLGILGGVFATGNTPVMGGLLTAGEYAGTVAGATAAVYGGIPNTMAAVEAGFTAGGAVTATAGIAAAGLAGYAAGSLAYCSVSCHLDTCSY
jgi:RHS repeat-associated protein